MSDAQIDQLKKDDQAFYNKVYGGRYGNAPGEGYKYRGRGFNGITFKGIYQNMQKLLDKLGKLDRKVDIVANPDVLNDIDVAAETAVLYFLDRASNPKMYQKYGVKDINAFKDQETALKAMVNANAGWGKDINNDYLRFRAKQRCLIYLLNLLGNSILHSCPCGTSLALTPNIFSSGHGFISLAIRLFIHVSILMKLLLQAHVSIDLFHEDPTIKGKFMLELFTTSIIWLPCNSTLISPKFLCLRIIVL
jgi:hypothetical protein